MAPPSASMRGAGTRRCASRARSPWRWPPGPRVGARPGSARALRRKRTPRPLRPLASAPCGVAPVRPSCLCLPSLHLSRRGAGSPFLAPSVREMLARCSLVAPRTRRGLVAVALPEQGRTTAARAGATPCAGTRTSVRARWRGRSGAAYYRYGVGGPGRIAGHSTGRGRWKPAHHTLGVGVGDEEIACVGIVECCLAGLCLAPWFNRASNSVMDHGSAERNLSYIRSLWPFARCARGPTRPGWCDARSASTSSSLAGSSLSRTADFVISSSRRAAGTDS